MTLVIAHRGDPIAHRENTIPAFRSAVESGADMVELDVQISKDRQCVILHDPTLHRLWNVDAEVAQLTYDEIRRATQAEEYEIPLLGDVLRAIEIPVMVDVTAADAIIPIVEVLKSLHAEEQVLFSGGNLEAHRRIRTYLPDADAALTWTQSMLPADELLAELKPNYLNPPWWLLLPGFDIPEAEGFKTLGPETVRAMHDRGMQVSVWTVDEMEIGRAWSRLGVDAIITNRASDMVTALRDQTSGTR
ncbi:glycerophosphodiester phosphodiesterase [Alicyclobacillus acidiphilus]|uniref:glycerophosphodiester phosphodiesterase n=1 Tax=Alicyclobacillus acidiphilus TaxID=182455 RepID=UPI00082DE8A7|nr:glycerophosphodiester phosphodiesterase [Alicyclobacillus acidiphilus]